MAVLADELSAGGDPRGELISLQLANEAWPGDLRVNAAIERHLAQHARALLGPLYVATSLLELHWSRGFIIDAKVASLASEPTQQGAAMVPRSSKVPWAVRQLLSLESARVLTTLRLEMEYSSFGTEQLLLAVEDVARRPVSISALWVQYREEPDRWWHKPALVAPCASEVRGVQVFAAGAWLLEQVLERFEAAGQGHFKFTRKSA